MYNEERKRAFIQSYTKSLNTADIAVNTFDALQPYEETYEKDMACFTVEELQPAINTILGIRSRSKWIRMTILREYVRWCQINRVPDAQDSIMHIDLLGLDKLREQMVSGPLHLQNYFNQVFDPESEETLDNIYRCWLWLGYSGIQEEDTLEIEDKDIDFSNLVIHFRGDEYPLYKEAIPAFRNAVGLTDFRYLHPNYGDKIVRRSRVDGHLLLRGIKATTKILTIRSTLSKHLTECQKKGKTTQKLSFYRVSMSGLFYRMYELERAGIPPDFGGFAVRDMEGKEYSQNSGVKLEWLQNRRARDYMEDYQRWKLAFSF